MKLVEDIFQSQKTNLFKVVMLKSDDLEFLADVYKGEVEGMMRSVAEGKRIEVNEHFAIVHIILKVIERGVRWRNMREEEGRREGRGRREKRRDEGRSE